MTATGVVACRGYLENGSFETGDTAPWRVYAGPSASPDGNIGRVVSTSQFSGIAPAGGVFMWEGGAGGGIEQLFNVSATSCVRDLHLSYRYMIDGSVPGSTGRCSFNFRSSSFDPFGNGGVLAQPVAASDRTWHESASDIPLRAGENSLGFWNLNCGSAAGEYRLYIDRVTVTPNCIAGCEG